MQGGKRSTSWKKGTSPVKKKGTKHKKTLIKEAIGLKNWEGLKDFIEKDGATKMVKELKALKGSSYVYALQGLIEYVKPKLARTEIKSESDININQPMTDSQVERIINSLRENQAT